MSPDVDLPRLDMLPAWRSQPSPSRCSACSYRRGRIFALIPATAAIAVWLSAPQAVGYVADDGSVFLKRAGGWVELTDWRGNNGLNPLIIGDVIESRPCAGKGAGVRWIRWPGR